MRQLIVIIAVFGAPVCYTYDTLTPAMPSAYMLSKTHYTATISNTIRASRKRLSALNAEYASLEVQRQR